MLPLLATLGGGQKVGKSQQYTICRLQLLNDKSIEHRPSAQEFLVMHFISFHFRMAHCTHTHTQISDEKSCTHSKCRINFTTWTVHIVIYPLVMLQQLSDNQNIRTMSNYRKQTQVCFAQST